MSTVYKRTRVIRTTFGKLPIGALYWPASDVTGAPLEKSGLKSSAGGFTTPTITQTAATLSTAVVRVPRVFTRQSKVA